PDHSAPRTGGSDAGLQPEPGVLVGGAAGGAAGGGDGGDAVVGAGAGRVRTGAGVLRSDATADRGAADDGVSGAVDRQFERGGGGVAADGGGGDGGAGDRARLRHGAGGVVREACHEEWGRRGCLDGGAFNAALAFWLCLWPRPLTRRPK